MEKAYLQQSTGRLSHIDLLKVIAIIFVVHYHTIGYVSPNFNTIQSASLPYFLMSILSTSVPIFFFVNGYLLLNRPINLKQHIKKLIRIPVLTVIWAFLTILALMPLKDHYLSAKEIVKHTLFPASLMQWDNHLWFLGALTVIYVIFPLLKLTFDHNKKIFIYFTTIISLVTFGNSFINLTGSLVHNYFFHSHSILTKNWFTMFNPFTNIGTRAIAYFCLGGLAYVIEKRVKDISIKKRNLIAVGTIIINCTILFLLGVGLSITTGKIWDIVFPAFFTLPAALNVLALYVLSLSYKGNYSIIKLVSTNTLGIYLMHMIMINIVMPHATKFYLANTFIGTFIMAIIITVISLVTVIAIKKIPVAKHLFSLG